MAPFGKGDTRVILSAKRTEELQNLIGHKRMNPWCLISRLFADDPLQIILRLRFLADDPAETLRKAYRNYVVKQP